MSENINEAALRYHRQHPPGKMEISATILWCRDKVIDHSNELLGLLRMDPMSTPGNLL
jgi:hypothetical protein